VNNNKHADTKCGNALCLSTIVFTLQSRQKYQRREDQSVQKRWRYRGPERKIGFLIYLIIILEFQRKKCNKKKRRAALKGIVIANPDFVGIAMAMISK